MDRRVRRPWSGPGQRFVAERRCSQARTPPANQVVMRRGWCPPGRRACREDHSRHGGECGRRPGICTGLGFQWRSLSRNRPKPSPPAHLLAGRRNPHLVEWARRWRSGWRTLGRTGLAGRDRSVTPLRPPEKPNSHRRGRVSHDARWRTHPWRNGRTAGCREATPHQRPALGRLRARGRTAPPSHHSRQACRAPHRCRATRPLREMSTQNALLEKSRAM